MLKHDRFQSHGHHAQPTLLLAHQAWLPVRGASLPNDPRKLGLDPVLLQLRHNGGTDALSALSCGLDDGLYRQGQLFGQERQSWRGLVHYPPIPPDLHCLGGGR